MEGTLIASAILIIIGILIIFYRKEYVQTNVSNNNLTSKLTEKKLVGIGLIFKIFALILIIGKIVY